MTRGLNDDLKIEVEPQKEKYSADRFPKPVKDGMDAAHAGYTTLDQASTDPYANKERRGTYVRDVTFPRRY